MAASTAAELRAGVSRHSGPRRGVSNQALARLARLMGAGDDFRGVYPADCIPVATLVGQGRFSLIVNLGRWKNPEERGLVGHFVAICATPGRRHLR